MKKVIFTCVASAVLALSVNSVVSAKGPQPVYSFKNLGEFTGSDGQEFTKLLVTCNSTPEPRYIQRIVGKKMWCIDGQANSCFKERIDSATLACTTDVETAVAVVGKDIGTAEITAADLAKAQQRQKLLADQLEVEQKRLEIEARRIELREREISLTASRDGG